MSGSISETTSSVSEFKISSPMPVVKSKAPLMMTKLSLSPLAAVKTHIALKLEQKKAFNTTGFNDHIQMGLKMVAEAC
jgi:hypothetical protein